MSLSSCRFDITLARTLTTILPPITHHSHTESRRSYSARYLFPHRITRFSLLLTRIVESRTNRQGLREGIILQSPLPPLWQRISGFRSHGGVKGFIPSLLVANQLFATLLYLADRCAVTLRPYEELWRSASLLLEGHRR